MAGRERRGAKNIVRQDGQDFRDLKASRKPSDPTLPLHWNILLADLSSKDDW
jgi:hypothetical protein